jgi:hypothetical protein
MTRQFVMAPVMLVRSAFLSDTAFWLWCLIRARNGENTMRGCFESANSLASYLFPHRRPKDLRSACIPSRFKKAQQALRMSGLLIVRSRGAPKPSLRWAILPGAFGEIEATSLYDRGDIGDQELAAFRHARAVSCVVGERPFSYGVGF